MGIQVEHSTVIGGEPEDLLRDMQLRLATADAKSTVMRDAGDALLIQRKTIPVWAILLAVFLFPIGLIALIARNTEVGTVSISSESPGRSRLRLAGKFPRKALDAINVEIEANSVPAAPEPKANTLPPPYSGG